MSKPVLLKLIGGNDPWHKRIMQGSKCVADAWDAAAADEMVASVNFCRGNNIDPSSPDPLKGMREDAANGSDWFNAFQAVQDFMFEQGMWDEQDVAESPSQTLINGLKRYRETVCREQREACENTIRSLKWSFIEGMSPRAVREIVAGKIIETATPAPEPKVTP